MVTSCEQQRLIRHGGRNGQSEFLLDALFINMRHHWRSSYYVVTHVRNKNSNIQGRSPSVVEVIL